ncbi:MAG: glycogen synthase GlgA [Candidatus Latescibacterota bacterium]
MSVPLKILICSSEVAPFAKTGGLGDVAGSLPLALSGLGHDVRVAMPKYAAIDEEKHGLKMLAPLEVPISHRTVKGALWTGKIEGGECKERANASCTQESPAPKSVIPVLFIAQEGYFNREQLYQEAGEDYRDNLARFTFFCRGTLEALKALDWKPDVIHVNDWQTALIPVYLKTLYANDSFFEGMGTVLTIHNLAFQGTFESELLPLTGLNWDEFVPEKLEFHGKLNLMKGGIVYADVLNTVSRQYGKEIQTEELGCGLSGLLASRSDALYGVLNGIDYSVWNPETDRHIAQNFGPDHLKGKQACKAALQKESGLPHRGVPLIGIISRLTNQKGCDLIGEVIEQIMGLDLQMVLLGTGMPKYHALFDQISKRYPKKMAVHLTFDNALAHRVEAGSDMFLMPSRYEPCGLNQLYSLKYGAVPIVHATGGLADTIVDYSPKNAQQGTANGFVFREYSGGALLVAIKLAVATYQDRETWLQLMRTGMKQDFSWMSSAAEYVSLYRKAKHQACLAEDAKPQP